MRDFKQNVLEDNYTVEEYYALSKLSRLRFYLAFKEKCSTVSTASDVSLDDISNTLLLEADSDVPISYNIVGQDSVGTETSNSLTEFYNNFDFTTELMLSTAENIKVHRGQVFQELLLHFSTIDLPCGQIFIEILLPNGTKEAAYDGGGVLRDALSEFWDTFYEKCTEGSDTKVPVIRDDFNAVKWEAAAKVLLKGWQQVKYFPIKLAPVFIEYCVFGMFFSDLRDS